MEILIIFPCFSMCYQEIVDIITMVHMYMIQLHVRIYNGVQFMNDF